MLPARVQIDDAPSLASGSMTIIMNDVYTWLASHELLGFGKTSWCFRKRRDEGFIVVVDDHRGCFRNLMYWYTCCRGSSRLKDGRMMIPIGSSKSDYPTALAIPTSHDRKSFPKILSWVHAHRAALYYERSSPRIIPRRPFTPTDVYQESCNGTWSPIRDSVTYKQCIGRFEHNIQLSSTEHFSLPVSDQDRCQ